MSTKPSATRMTTRQITIGEAHDVLLDIGVQRGFGLYAPSVSALYVCFGEDLRGLMKAPPSRSYKSVDFLYRVSEACLEGRVQDNGGAGTRPIPGPSCLCRVARV